jgi:ABC-2 type transport system permease protein
MLIIFLSGMLIWQMLPFVMAISILQFLGFLIMTVLGGLIVYFSITLYTAAGFYLTRAGQIIEVYAKISDFAQYPLGIFPLSFQLIAVFIIPLAFFSYLPTLFLLGRGKLSYVLLAITVMTTFALINKVVWKESMKKYSSASS